MFPSRLYNQLINDVSCIDLGQINGATVLVITTVVLKTLNLPKPTQTKPYLTYIGLIAVFHSLMTLTDRTADNKG